jgi:membrane-associated protein
VTTALGPAWLDSQHLLQSLGGFALWGTAIVLFVECGVFAFFLPGDSLLFTVGLFVGRGNIHHSLWLVCLILTAAAFAGNVVGYEIGRKAGPALFNRPDSRIFKQQYVDQTVAFFDKYGPRAIVLARFVPIVRTFLPFVAGGAGMPYAAFLTYNAIGAVAWVGICAGAGYLFGNIPVVKENFELVVLGIVGVSVLPIVIEFVKMRRARA